jgi:hypothetical protein
MAASINRCFKMPNDSLLSPGGRQIASEGVEFRL